MPAKLPKSMATKQSSNRERLASQVSGAPAKPRHHLASSGVQSKKKKIKLVPKQASSS